MGTFNVATGKMEEDPADGGVPPLPPDPVSPPAIAPPVAVPPIAPPTPTPVIPPIVPSKPKSTPTLPGMGLPVSSQTISGATVSGKIVSPEMKDSDKEVADAVEQGRKANELDAANALKKAEIDQHDLDIKIQERRLQGQQAKERADEATRARAALEKKVSEDDQKYRDAAASDPKGFWGKDGDETVTRKSWALSLMFGNIAHALGGENVGARLLDKTMTEWKTTREANLAKLEKRALASSGLLQTFWREHGAEAKAQKEIQDGAAQDLWADEIEANGVRSRGLIEDTVLAANAQVAAKYRQNAADARAKALEMRAQTLTTGGGSVTYAGPSSAAGAAAADKARAETLLDLDGNVVGQALTEKEGQEVRKAHASTSSLVSAVEELKAFTRKNGTANLDPSLDQQRGIMVGRIAGFVTQAYQTGALQENEYKRYSNMLAGKWWQDKNGAANALSGMQDSARAGYTDQLRAQGVKIPSGAGKAAPAGGVRKLVDGKPAMIYPDGTMEAL